MPVQVKLLGEFGENLKREYSFEDVHGLTVGKVLEMLDIDRKEISMVIINGSVTHIDDEIPLADGDALSLLPALEGG